MARRFTLQPGESVLSSHYVALVDGRTTLPAYIHLTTDRLVVTGGKRTGKGWLFLLGLPIFVALRQLAAEAPRIHYQMKRERFASIEPGDAGMLVFRDKGEGYDHVSFAITHELTTSIESLSTWEKRLYAWAIMVVKDHR
jgi:hypothetical protein